MANEKEEEVPKKRASLRSLLQSQNLKDERVLREREKKNSRRRMSQQQRNKISQRMKDYWADKKEVRGLLRFVGETVRETGRAFINSINDDMRATRCGNGDGTGLRTQNGNRRPRTQNANRRPRTNRKTNKKNKGKNTKKNQRNRRAQKKARTSTRRPVMTRTSAMRARRGERRGRPSHA